jgi:hypothetical protein
VTLVKGGGKEANTAMDQGASRMFSWCNTSISP